MGLYFLTGGASLKKGKINMNKKQKEQLANMRMLLRALQGKASVEAAGKKLNKAQVELLAYAMYARAIGVKV